jgi:hypothetical protein
MEKITTYKILITIGMAASLFSGPLYNLLIFLNTWVLNSYWSIYVDNIYLINTMTWCFILFTIIFLISTKYVEKLAKEPFIITAIIIIGFNCIFAGLIWVWEIVVLVFYVTTATLAFLIPIITKYTHNKIKGNFEDTRYILILPIASFIWIAISFLLFAQSGISWRILFFVAGGINFLSSLLIAFT